ncbi:MAG: GTP-binding protein [Candidatus Lokiarchaeota archaeon]|nr:GTP-binding protein [Candidatus Lokiarchaeota archaeon]MBD3339425.1 GTP-binding protein [Candidatus Lokiarchaeota archaeon]
MRISEKIVKIVVDGYGGVGKTTMLKKLQNGVFDPETQLTIGVDFFTNEYEYFGKQISAQIWDLVGAKRFNFLRPICYKGANALILVCDLTRPITLERIDYFVETARKVNITPDQIILTGTKTDLFYERNIDRHYITAFSEDYGFAEVIETSARNSHNLEVLFEIATNLAMYKKGLINQEEFSGINELLKNRIKDSNKEICQRPVRKCWKCNRSLYYYEFCDTNLSNFSEERLLELWENNHIEFYCCACYKELKKNK